MSWRHTACALLYLFITCIAVLSQSEAACSPNARVAVVFIAHSRPASLQRSIASVFAALQFGEAHWAPSPNWRAENTEAIDREQSETARYVSIDENPRAERYVLYPMWESCGVFRGLFFIRM